MSIALVVALALALPQDPAATSQHLHPEGVDIVMTVPDFQAALGAFRETALERTMMDADVHAAVGEVMGDEPVDPVGLLVAGLRDLEGQIPPILDMHKGVRSVSMSLDLGDFEEGLVESLFRLMEDGAARPGLAFRVMVDFEDAASCEAWVEAVGGAEQLMPSGPSSTRAMTLAGDGGAFTSPRLTVTEFPGSIEGAEQYLIHGGSRALMVAGVRDLDAELARLSDAAPGAYSALTEAGRLKLGAPTGAVVLELSMPDAFGLSAMAKVMDMDGGEGTGIMLVSPLATMLELMLGAPATAMLRGGHWCVSIDEDGRYQTRGWISDSVPEASFKMVGTAPLQAGSLTLAHPDALVTSVASFDPQELLELLVQASPDVDEGSLEELHQGMESSFGFRIDRDLIEPLGGSISYSLPKLRSLLSAPNLMAVASLKDREAFVRGMDGLLAMMTQVAGEADGQRTEYRGATIYTWSLDAFMGGGTGMQSIPLPIDPSSFTRPTVTVMEDRVLISTLPSHAKREVRRVAKLIDAGDGAELHAGLSARGVPAGTTMVSYAQWPVFIGNLYTQLRALAPMIGNLAGGGADLPVPFKLKSLPEMELLTRHFAASERRWAKVEGGFLDRSVSSLGPEVPALILGMGVSSVLFIPKTMGAEAWDESALEVEEPGEPLIPLLPSQAMEETQAALMGLEVAVRVYQLDHNGELPSTLSELTRGEAGQPAYLVGGLSDGWGRLLRYKRTESGYKAWSLGADAVDDEGLGDDPVRTFVSPIK